MSDTAIVAQDAVSKTGCDCLDVANAPDGVLAMHNTRLDETWEIDRVTGRTIERVMLSVSVRTKKRGARPIRVLANYCPLCGMRYPSNDEPEDEAPQ